MASLRGSIFANFIHSNRGQLVVCSKEVIIAEGVREAQKSGAPVLAEGFAEGFLAGEDGDQVRIGMVVHVFADHIRQAVFAGAL